MKKLLYLLLALALLCTTMVACEKSDYATGEYTFSAIAEVKLKDELDQEFIDELLTDYGVATVAELESEMTAEYIEDEIFEPGFLRFDGKRVTYYDFIMNRDDAVYVYYETAENEGFFSVYTDLNAADGNPDPATNPPYTYNAATKTISVTYSYGPTFVTIDYVAK